MVIGVGVDANDHVFIVHRGQATLNARTEGGYPATGPCCSAAPPVLEFDPEGTSVKLVGRPGQGYTWPGSNHGITIDHLWQRLDRRQRHARLGQRRLTRTS